MKRYIIILFICTLAACANSQKPAKTPPHYNINSPVVFKMPEGLREISGITILPGTNLFLAEQDEEGKVFYFKLGDTKIAHTKFGAKGDYEDIALHNNRVFMLRSDGTLFSFPVSQLMAGAIKDVKTWAGMLPKGEYEGLYADPYTASMYVLCKHCKDENTSKVGGGYIFSVKADGSLTPNGSFEIDVKEIGKMTGAKKIDFHPSALAKNPVTGEWYIVSSVNQLLVVADKDWRVKDVYPLGRSVFNQPEGIAFDSTGNLYISNEGGDGYGNILKFAFKK